MQDKKKLHNSKVEIYYWAEFDFAYNQIYREAVTIIPNSELVSLGKETQAYCDFLSINGY